MGWDSKLGRRERKVFNQISSKEQRTRIIVPFQGSLQEMTMTSQRAFQCRIPMFASSSLLPLPSSLPEVDFGPLFPLSPSFRSFSKRGVGFRGIGGFAGRRYCLAVRPLDLSSPQRWLPSDIVSANNAMFDVSVSLWPCLFHFAGISMMRCRENSS